MYEKCEYGRMILVNKCMYKYQHHVEYSVGLNQRAGLWTRSSPGDTSVRLLTPAAILLPSVIEAITGGIDLQDNNVATWTSDLFYSITWLSRCVLSNILTWSLRDRYKAIYPVCHSIYGIFSDGHGSDRCITKREMQACHQS